MSPNRQDRGTRRDGSTRLEEARREAERRLRRLREGLQREVGFAPGRKGLWLLVAAGAVGLALAAGTAVRRSRRGSKKTRALGDQPSERKPRRQKAQKLSR